MQSSAMSILHAAKLSAQVEYTVLARDISQETSMKSVSLGTAVLFALFTFPAHAADTVPLKKANGMLVDARGMTVYTSDKDTADSGKSSCAGPCAINWPAVQAGDAPPAAPYSTITREDGTKQLAYKGKPLYTFVKDKKAGDKTGDKLMNAWHVVTD
jgi:predicted lipoprotein with Yx(FWY)xxD motif